MMTWEVRGSFAHLSTSFLCLLQRSVIRKSTTILSCSLDCIPLLLGSTICSWFRFTLALCWPAVLSLLSFSDWQVFNDLEDDRPLWAREVWAWHPRHRDEPLLRQWHYKSFIKWEEKMLYSAQATEQHCINSRGHGSLVASGKRSTRCHKVTER